MSILRNPPNNAIAVSNRPDGPGAVALVSVPAQLGPRVRSWLTMLLTPAPVLAVADTGDERWLFLCQPATQPKPHVHNDIEYAGVKVIGPVPGTSHTPDSDNARWIVHPREVTASLPELPAVIYAARRAIAGMQ